LQEKEKADKEARVQQQQEDEQRTKELREEEMVDKDQGAGTPFKDLLEGTDSGRRRSVPPPPSSTPPEPEDEDEQELFQQFLAQRKMQSKGTKISMTKSARKSSAPPKKKGR
jgi:hypothetical protein